ncbi:beta-ketoacyl synthase N-terminal-like domain-containing protein [Gordonia sp. CPCC 205515]|uniref:beta-ketoacyl synthase N-terminal-like domain-containing protein n=1 Tax=Gordonia sp. CPCC 205515 TaxID=3140791 RepID=UPI003AF351EF
MNTSATTISGVGAVTGYGWGRDRLWSGLTSGKSCASLHPGFGTSLDDPGWVARIPDDGDSADGKTRFSRAMRWSAREAIHDAMARGWTPGPRVGLISAVVLGDLDMFPMIVPGTAASFTGREYVSVTPSTPVSLLMQEFGFHGPAMSVSAMCTSGIGAVITAKIWLDSGMADDVIVVATDLSATPEVVRMFVQLGVAITDVDFLDSCRPFQQGSRGFGFGEASVAFTMTNRPSAGYGRVLGGSMSHDAFHATSVDPTLTQVTACVDAALASAGVGGADIRYLNAHGPGTAQCDAAEGAIARTRTPNAEVFSVKPLAGHCQAAAGAVELAATLLGHQHGGLPAPPQVADPAFPAVLNGSAPMEHGLTLKTSLGMGGHNAAVVIGPMS